jgi:hypothetical protein
VNDVWGTNSSGQVFRYDPATGVFNEVVGNCAAIAAGGDGIWCISGSDSIWFFYSSSEAFVQVSGALLSIAVGSGAGVFGINDSDQVFTFVRP